MGTYARRVAPDLRLAFVGQGTYFSSSVMEAPEAGIVPAFFELAPGGRPGVLLAALHSFAPDVVIVFRPELLPAGAFAELDALTVGYLTEPLPRSGGDAVVHPDLHIRLETLRDIDPGNFDRIVCFDPLLAETVDPIVPVWRSLPIPIADSIFAPVRDTPGRPRHLFVGRSTAHRERFLGPVKHDFDVVHLAHGISEDRLREFLGESDVGINLHNEPYPTFENRVGTLMAAGLLVISESLSPRHGLLPGTDYVEVAQPWELWEIASALRDAPDAFATVRHSGRDKAERFRASRVYPALVRDLLEDVSAFGTTRPAPAPGPARARATATPPTSGYPTR